MWHPENEAEACSTLAALVEWLRASRGLDALDPASLRAWHDADTADFVAAFACFAPQTETAMRPGHIAALFAEWDEIRQRSKDPATP